MQNENRYKELDAIAWNQGSYFRDALLSVYHMFNALATEKSKKFPYPQKPYSVTKEEEKARKAKKAKLELKAKEIEKHNAMIQKIIMEKRASGAPSD